MSSGTWEEVSLGEICHFKYGKSLPRPSRIPGHIAVFGSNGPVGTHTTPLTNGPTVVVGRKGSFGEVAYSDVSCWPIDTTYYVDSSATNVDLRWLYYRLSAMKLTELNRAAAIPGLNREDAYRKRLLLPPIDQQRQIADLLDQADGLRAKRRQTIALLDDLVQSTFLEMFGDPATNPKNWEVIDFGSIVQEFRYGTSNKSGNGGLPALRIPNVLGGKMDLRELKLVSVTEVEEDRLRLTDGDLLFVRTNGNRDYVGRCAVFSENSVRGTGYASDQFIYASYLIRARLRPGPFNPEYVREFMLSGEGRRVLRERCKTSAGQFNINIDGLGRISLPCPPMALQSEFSKTLTQIDAVRAVHEAHLAELDELFGSLQARAFRGEL